MNTGLPRSQQRSDVLAEDDEENATEDWQGGGCDHEPKVGFVESPSSPTEVMPMAAMEMASGSLMMTTTAPAAANRRLATSLDVIVRPRCLTTGVQLLARALLRVLAPAGLVTVSCNGMLGGAPGALLKRPSP
jgi:hypothetical protein